MNTLRDVYFKTEYGRKAQRMVALTETLESIFNDAEQEMGKLWKKICTKEAFTNDLGDKLTPPQSMVTPAQLAMWLFHLTNTKSATEINLSTVFYSGSHRIKSRNGNVVVRSNGKSSSFTDAPWGSFPTAIFVEAERLYNYRNGIAITIPQGFLFNILRAVQSHHADPDEVAYLEIAEFLNDDFLVQCLVKPRRHVELENTIEVVDPLNLLLELHKYVDIVAYLPLVDIITEVNRYSYWILRRKMAAWPYQQTEENLTLYDSLHQMWAYVINNMELGEDELSIPEVTFTLMDLTEPVWTNKATVPIEPKFFLKDKDTVIFLKEFFSVNRNARIFLTPWGKDFWHIQCPWEV